MKFVYTSVIWSVVLIAGAIHPLISQVENSDSTTVLDEIVIRAYRSDRPLSEVPATVNVLNEKDLNRFGGNSLVPVANTVPGVRMEERSPGSYRFSIRGSLLRSPFGVRNVKFYWKGLPMTDGGGNTYLNIFDLGNIGSMEIIKGPGASLYGAGTGGVVLLEPQTGKKRTYENSIMAGMYGMWRLQAASPVLTSTKSLVTIKTSIQGYDGYREQTEMKRTTGQLDWDFDINNRNTLTTTLITSALYYETPGGLTKAQFDANPRSARPGTPVAAGAIDQKAAVTNGTSFLASMYEHDWNDRWLTRAGIFGSATNFKNPSIRNVEERKEWNGGARTETQFRFEKQLKGKLTFGGEFQYFYSPLAVYDNALGVKGNLQTDDKLRSTSGLIFAQAEIDLPQQFFLTLGGSANFLKYDFQRVNVSPEISQTRKFDPGFFPRVALLKKFTQAFSVFGSISNGFSAPSLAEVRPSTGAFNPGLQPEQGLNSELGMRISAFKKRIQLNVSAYDFRLKETIVIQREEDGADYFVNAGRTSQKGIESTLLWSPQLGNSHLSDFRIWGSYTLNDYHFTDYVNDGKNFSGNTITGIAPNVIVGGLDLTTRKGWYVNVTVNFTDRIALNDANSEFASDYTLLGSRIGKKQRIKKLEFDFFAGVDNALDQCYSLGNDLNAIGNRYYNAAVGRNFYGGIRVPFTR